MALEWLACFRMFVVRQTSEVNHAVRDRGQQRVVKKRVPDSTLKKLAVKHDMVKVHAGAPDGTYVWKIIDTN